MTGDKTGDENPTDEKARKIAAARAAKRLGLYAAALALAVTAIFAAFAQYGFFGAGFHVNFALLLGVLGTVFLGAGLMALSFYSARSGADDAVINLDEEEDR